MNRKNLRAVCSVLLAVIIAASMFPAVIAQAAGSLYRIVLEPIEFYRTTPFNNGVAAVCQVRDTGDRWEQQWAVISPDGGIVVPYGTYIYISEFSEGLAGVQNYIGDRLHAGVIDTSGRLVVPMTAEYQWVQPFSDGLAAVQKFERYYYDDDYYEYISTGTGVIDTSGRLVMPVSGSFEHIGSFSDGVATVYGRISEDSRGTEPAVIDTAGNIIVPFGVYSRIGDFSEGLASVTRRIDEDSWEEEYAVIDKTGELVIPFGTYYYIGSFSEGLATVTRRISSDNWETEAAVIDRSGRIIIPFAGYSTIGAFSGGLASVSRTVSDGGNRRSESAVIDRTGKFIIPFGELDAGIGRISDGLAWISSVRTDENGWPVYLQGVIRITADPPPATVIPVEPTASRVLVNGAETAFDAYLIGGNNYFKLRDLAYALNGTGKQFNIGWDAEANAILLTSGEAYDIVGGELEPSTITGSITAAPTTSAIYLDGELAEFTAYNIGGNNYFKLRDVMQAFDVYVGWDEATSTITLDTSMGYEN